MLNINCPQCGDTLQVEERYAGQTGKCRQCGAPVTVPPMAVAVPSSAAENDTAQQTDVPAAEATPNTPAEPGTAQALLGCSLIILVVVLFGWLLYSNISCNPGKSRQAPKAKPAATAPQKDTGDPIAAFTMSQQFVKDRLVSPGSAEFPWYSKEMVTTTGKEEYHVSSYVDSQNKFGALLRINYTCTLIYHGKDKWECRDLQLQER